jgi:hypothetical protein
MAKINFKNQFQRQFQKSISISNFSKNKSFVGYFLANFGIEINMNENQRTYFNFGDASAF